jgi:hypothetical protein
MKNNPWKKVGDLELSTHRRNFAVKEHFVDSPTGAPDLRLEICDSFYYRFKDVVESCDDRVCIEEYELLVSTTALQVKECFGNNMQVCYLFELLCRWARGEKEYLQDKCMHIAIVGNDVIQFQLWGGCWVSQRGICGDVPLRYKAKWLHSWQVSCRSVVPPTGGTTFKYKPGSRFFVRQTSRV